jgi:hypothetical protein
MKFPLLLTVINLHQKICRVYKVDSFFQTEFSHYTWASNWTSDFILKRINLFTTWIDSLSMILCFNLLSFFFNSLLILLSWLYFYFLMKEILKLSYKKEEKNSKFFLTKDPIHFENIRKSHIIYLFIYLLKSISYF